MEFILQAAYAAAFYIFTIVMLETLYVRKNLRKRTFAAIVLSAAVLMYVISIFNIPALNFTYSGFSVLLLNKTLYQCKGKMFIIYDLILVLLMTALEVVSTLAISLTLRLEINVILNNLWYRAAAMVLYWIIMFIAFRILLFSIQLHSITRVKTMELLLFLLLTAGELYFLHYINTFLLNSSEHYEISIILALFLGVDIYIAYLIHKISKSYVLENELKLTKQQALIQLNVYKDLIVKYDSSRKIIHDARKHINALEGLIDGDYMETARRYTGLLYTELDKLSPEFISDSAILSVIINDKLDEADNNGILFEIDIQYSDLSFMSEIDITAIFANLLDNAFEACEALSRENRYVKLIVMRYNDFLIINISNRYERINTSPEGTFLSTKDGHQGIGMTSIRNTVEKYSGTFVSEAGSERFVAKITIPIIQNQIAEQKK